MEGALAAIPDEVRQEGLPGRRIRIALVAFGAHRLEPHHIRDPELGEAVIRVV